MRDGGSSLDRSSNQHLSIDRFEDRLSRLNPAIKSTYYLGSGVFKIDDVVITLNGDKWMLARGNLRLEVRHEDVKKLETVDLIIDGLRMPSDRAIAVQQILSIAEDALNDGHESEAMALLKRPDLMKWIVKAIQEEHEIIGDEHFIAEVFLTMLSTLTRDPLNFHPSSRAGTGRSYIATRVAKCFPEDMLIILSGATEKSLVYSSKKVDEDRRELELWGKILLILEAENATRFIDWAKPLLSHDLEELEYLATDSDGKGLRKAWKIKLKGWPAWIILSTKPYTDEERRRRFTIDGPMMSVEKYENVNRELLRNQIEPWQKDDMKPKTKIIQKMIEILRNEAMNLNYYLEGDENEILSWATRFGNDAESMSRREQWLRYCKAIALLYSHQLPKKSINGKIYVAIPKWIRKAAYELMKPSIKGIERDLIRFLLKLRDLANQKTEGKDDKKDDESPPWTYRKLLKIAREVVGGRLSMNTLKRRYIFPLEDLGYLEIDREPKTHLINLSIDGLDFVEENKPILSFFRPENPSNPSKQIFEEREGVLGGKNLGEGVKNSSTDLSDYRGNPLNQSPPWINPRSSETPLISENKLGEGSKIDLDGFDRSLREINGFPRIFYMREGYEVYRGSKPLGRTGLAIMLRRFLKANNKDVGIGAVAEEIRRWPLEEGLRAEDLPHQIYVIKRLIRGSKHHWRRKFSFGITNKVLKIAE